MQDYFQPTVRPSSTQNLAKVPTGIPAVFVKIHDFDDCSLHKLSLKSESLYHREHSLHHKDETVTPIFKKWYAFLLQESYKTHRSMCYNKNYQQMRLFVLCLYFLFLVFSLHVSGLHGPVIRGISSCCFYATIWFMQCFVDRLRASVDAADARRR